MSLLSSLVPLLGALMVPAVDAPQGEQLPSGLPAPSLKPYQGQLEDALDGDFESAGLWHHIQPHAALTSQDSWDFARARRERAEVVAELNGWSESQAQDWLRKTAPQALSLNYRLVHGERVLAAGEETVLPEHPVTLGSFSSAAVVADYSVEIAQNSAIGDPVMRDAYLGATIGVVVLPLPDGRWWLETAVTALEPGEDQSIDSGSTEIGPKTRDHRKILEFSGPLLVGVGAQTGVELPGGYLLQFAINGEASPSVHQAGRAIALDLPTLGVDPALQSLLDEAGAEVLWADAAGFLLLDSERGQQAVDWMTQEASDVQRCDFMVARAQTERSPNLALVDLRVSGVQGRSYRFAHGRAFDSLVDWEVEVASSSRMADPEYRRVFAGFLGEVSANLVDGEVTHSLCDLEWSAAGSIESVSYQIAGPTQPAEGRSGLPSQFVNIEKVDRAVSQFRWSGSRGTAQFKRHVPKSLGIGEIVDLHFEVSADS